MNDERPTQFGLYAGQGGFELAFESEGFRCVGISELDPEAGLVSEHWFPDVVNHGDILAGDFVERVRAACGEFDVLTGGIPCQPASLLGKRLGSADERWLWPRSIEVLGGLRPRFALFENPSAILTVDDGRAWNGIMCGLAEVGYDCWWQPVPAAIFGAGHLRERILIVAANTDYTGRARQSERQREKMGGEQQCQHVRPCAAHSDAGVSGRDTWTGLCEGVARGERVGRPSDVSEPETVADATDDPRFQGQPRLHDESRAAEQARGDARRHLAAPDLRGRVSSDNWWHESNSGIPVLAHGISSKLAEASCRLTGNAVVPQVIVPFARAFKTILAQAQK